MYMYYSVLVGPIIESSQSETETQRARFIYNVHLFTLNSSPYVTENIFRESAWLICYKSEYAFVKSTVTGAIFLIENFLFPARGQKEMEWE
jgi:hypothetical protein